MSVLFIGLVVDILEDRKVFSTPGLFLLDRGFYVASFVHSMVLKVDIAFCILNAPSLVANCFTHNYSGALFLVYSGFSKYFYVRGIMWPVILSLSSLRAQLLDILGNWSTMDTQDNELHHDKEMLENDFEERQCLFIQVSSLSSIVLFSLTPWFNTGLRWDKFRMNLTI